MFKILVADDEKFIRKGIISILTRNLDEPVKCFEAKNGIQALQQAEEETPDLIITDINMPGCDGLEFVKQLKEIRVNVPVIILSGHENFEYAKQAISLGIKEYIMKPIKKEDFIQMVKRYMNDIQQQQLKTKEEIERKIESNRIVERVKLDFLVGLLKCSDNQEAHQYLKQLKALNMNFEPQLCTCVVFQYDVNPENQEYIGFVVKNILDEYLNLESDEFIMNVPYEVSKVVTIVKCGISGWKDEARKKVIRNAARLVRDYGKVRVFAGVGDVVPDFEHLNVALSHALIALEYKIFERGDIVSAYEEIEEGEPVQPRAWSKQHDILDILAELNRIYALGQTRQVLGALKGYYDQERKYINDRISAEEDVMCKEFSLCWNLDEIKNELKGGLEKRTEFEEDRGHLNTQLMEQVVRFVDNNITKELDLNMIGEKFRRTPGYISTMFKRYVEGGFNSYVTTKRMEIARNLLKDRSVPVQEIAEACGYYNAKYFSVVFKKYTGQTPTEYRESHTV